MEESKFYASRLLHQVKTTPRHTGISKKMSSTIVYTQSSLSTEEEAESANVRQKAVNNVRMPFP